MKALTSSNLASPLTDDELKLLAHSGPIKPLAPSDKPIVVSIQTGAKGTTPVVPLGTTPVVPYGATQAVPYGTTHNIVLHDTKHETINPTYFEVGTSTKKAIEEFQEESEEAKRERTARATEPEAAQSIAGASHLA